MESQETFNLKEVAVFLKININTARKYIKLGKIKGHRMGKKWLFLKSEIVEQIKKFE